MDENFTLVLSLTSRFEKPTTVAIRVDHETMSISHRAVSDLQSDFGLMSFDSAVRLMRTKEYRRNHFMSLMQQLGQKLCDHLEDEEGWHGMDRQEGAMAARGG